MEEVSIVGVDLAKQVFQVHGAAPDGRVCFARNCRGRNFRDLWPDFGRVWLRWRRVC
jgi:hypothetical protein